MEQVGMRQLRHRLRHYLARVEAGERFGVTVFGRTVAELGPPSDPVLAWERLVANGQVTMPVNPDTTGLPEPRPSTTGVSATEALLAERRADPR